MKYLKTYENNTMNIPLVDAIANLISNNANIVDGLIDWDTLVYSAKKIVEIISKNIQKLDDDADLDIASIIKDYLVINGEYIEYDSNWVAAKEVCGYLEDIGIDNIHNKYDMVIQTKKYNI